MTSSKVERPPAMNTRPRTILIVEDDAHFRRLLSLGLRMAGFDTCEARDGYEAIRILEWAAPHLDGVILDLALPGLDGFAVRDELLANPKTRLLPIIVVTGIDAPLEDMDVACVHRKPTTPDEVIAIVERCVRHAKG